MAASQALEAITAGITRILTPGAMQIAAPGLTVVDLAYALRTIEEVSDRDDAYRHYQAYYDGNHHDPTALNFKDHPLTEHSHFSAGKNFCATVVDVLEERLEVTGFTIDTTGTPRNADQLWRWWQFDRMDIHSRTVHLQSLVKGDAFVLVHWDAARNRPRFSVEDALFVTPVYDAEHTQTAVYKAWTEEYVGGRNEIRTRRRVNRYTPGLVLKFVDEGDNRWTLWTGDLNKAGQPDGGRIDMTDPDGRPLPIPFVHFRHRPGLDDFGRSELASVLAFQDEINYRSWSSHQNVGFAGAKQKYVFGVQEPAGGWRAGPNIVWTGQSVDDRPVQVGQFDASDVAQLEDAYDREIKRMAGQTGTPVHLIWPEGGLPSGESLKAAEARLAFRARACQQVFGNAWEEVMRIAALFAWTFGQGERPVDDALIVTQWAGVELVTELDMQRAGAGNGGQAVEGDEGRQAAVTEQAGA